jgi:HAD superfamily hydrolase (TIGR01450 family)
VPLSPAVRPYDQVLLDLDGTIWVGDGALPGAAEAVTALREAGKGVLYLTNDVRLAPEAFVRKLWRLGFQASLAEVVSVGAALQFWLAERDSGGAAFVVGSQALVDHVAEAGLRVVNGTEFATRADVVVVGGHDRFDFNELKVATQAVLRGAELIGATRDATFPMPDGPWPGTGAIVAAVEAATGVHAATVGKPAPEIFRTALDRLGPGRALMVGDREDADLAGALAAGLDGALVGGERSDDAVACAATLAELVLA